METKKDIMPETRKYFDLLIKRLDTIQSQLNEIQDYQILESELSEIKNTDEMLNLVEGLN
jgi:CHAD domain-containing protein